MKHPFKRRFIVIFCILISGNAWATGNLCSQVLTKRSTITPDDLGAAIENLARLKVNLDLDRVQGTRDGTVKMFSDRDFMAKKKQLQETLKGHYDAREIDDMVQVAIRKIQNLQMKMQREEKVQRQDHEVKLETYKLKQQVPIANVDGNIEGYSSSNEMIVIKSRVGHSLYLLSLKDQSRIEIHPSVQDTAISADGKTLVATGFDSSVLVYDLQNLKKIVSYPMKLHNIAIDFVLSPNGEKILFHDDHSAYLADTKTGQKEFAFSGDFQGGQSRMAFLSNDKIVFTVDKAEIQTFEISSNVVEKFKAGGDRINAVLVSPDGQSIIWTSYNMNGDKTHGLIDVADIKDIANRSQILPGRAEFHPYKDLVYSYSGDSRSLHERANIENIVAAFPFERSEFSKIEFSEKPLFINPEGERIYLPRTHYGEKYITIEVWER